MSESITLTLPDDVLRRAELVARRSRRPVADILMEAIETSLKPLGGEAVAEDAPGSWSDKKVLAAADAQMSEAEDARLSALLESQQSGLLTGAERSELAALMERYQDGLLRKAQALHEAVRRGLREPLQP